MTKFIKTNFKPFIKLTSTRINIIIPTINTPAIFKHSINVIGSDNGNITNEGIKIH